MERTTRTVITKLGPDEKTDAFLRPLTSYEFEATVTSVERINARAAKRGLSGSIGIVYRVIKETEEHISGIPITKVWYETDLVGTAPAYKGWEFLAEVDFDPNAGIILNKASDKAGALVDRSIIRRDWCGHCKSTRYRRRSYIVRHVETGEIVQVGTTCIKDFLGWSGGVVIINPRKVEDEVFGIGMGFSGVAEYSPETVLAVAYACIQKFGYTPSYYLTSESTADQVKRVLCPSKNQSDREFAWKLRDIAEESQDKAKEILEYLRSDAFDPKSEYDFNLKAVARGQYVSQRYVGLLASAPLVWFRHQERELARKAAAEKPSEWIGQEKDRILFTGRIEAIRYIDGVYGTTTLYQLRDELSGAIVKWFASTAALGHDKGRRMTIRGTVKKHDEYNGIKSTVLTRCTLIEEDVLEPAPWVNEGQTKTKAKRKARK